MRIVSEVCATCFSPMLDHVATSSPGPVKGAENCLARKASPRIEHGGRICQDPKKREPTLEIPYGCSEHSARLSDPLHLACGFFCLRYEVQHKQRQGGIELRIAIGQGCSVPLFKVQLAVDRF